VRKTAGLIAGLARSTLSKAPLQRRFRPGRKQLKPPFITNTMKLLFDFFPILLFFITYKVFDIYTATAVAIVASIIQVMVAWLKTRKFETMHLMTLVIIVVFGGLTLYLQDEQFIKWKPTVVNWLFGFVFLSSQWLGDKTMMERMMGGNLTLPSTIWRTLNLGWTLFFFLIGGVNYYVMSFFNTDTWVNFKLFGMLGLTFLFVLLQSFYLSRHLPESSAEEE
jgi:intracellular septation protein